jgi:hypothetical protein
MTTTRLSGRLAAAILAAAALLTTLSAPTAQAAVTPRYIVTVDSFTAVEESGNDWFGSDEVYGGFEITDDDGEYEAGFRSQLIKGFDAGETKYLDLDRNCLPHRQLLERVSRNPFLDARAGDRWLCTASNTLRGVTGPITITGHLYEQESCPVDCTYLRHFLLFPWLADDESLGRAELSFSEAQLGLLFPTVGKSRQYTMEHRDSGAHYRSSILITRVV